MESGTSEKSIKSDILRIENLYWAIVTALVLALVYIFRDTFGVAGLIVALLALITMYLGYRNYKLKEEINELCSDELRKNEVRTIFLKQLMDPSTLLGNDVLIRHDSFDPAITQIGLDKGEIVEILAFSSNKFNISLMKQSEYNKLRDVGITYEERTLDGNVLIMHKIKTDMTINNTSSVKTRFEAEVTGRYVFIFTWSFDGRKEDSEVSFILSKIPPLHGFDPM